MQTTGVKRALESVIISDTETKQELQRIFIETALAADADDDKCIVILSLLQQAYYGEQEKIAPQIYYDFCRVLADLYIQLVVRSPRSYRDDTVYLAKTKTLMLKHVVSQWLPQPTLESVAVCRCLSAVLDPDMRTTDSVSSGFAVPKEPVRLSVADRKLLLGIVRNRLAFWMHSKDAPARPYDAWLLRPDVARNIQEIMAEVRGVATIIEDIQLVHFFEPAQRSASAKTMLMSYGRQIALLDKDVQRLEHILRDAIASLHVECSIEFDWHSLEYMLVKVVLSDDTPDMTKVRFTHMYQKMLQDIRAWEGQCCYSVHAGLTMRYGSETMTSC